MKKNLMFGIFSVTTTVFPMTLVSCQSNKLKTLDPIEQKILEQFNSINGEYEEVKEEFKLKPKYRINKKLVQELNTFLQTHDEIKKIMQNDTSSLYLLDENDLSLRHFTAEFLTAMDLFYFENDNDYLEYTIIDCTDNVKGSKNCDCGVQEGQSPHIVSTAWFTIEIKHKLKPLLTKRYKIKEKGFKFVSPHNHFSKIENIQNLKSIAKSWKYNFKQTEEITNAYDKILKK